MSSLKSGFPLLENERLILEVESGLYVTSSCWFFRLLWGTIRPFLRILGFSRKGFLVVTDKRFIELYTQTIFWFIKLRRNAEIFPLKKIKDSVKYVKMGRFLFFGRSYHVSYDRSCLTRVYWVLKGMEEAEASKLANYLYQTITLPVKETK